MIIVDTSGVLAGLDPRQAHHRAAHAHLWDADRRILSPFVLGELEYMLATRTHPAEALKLLRDVERGVYELATFETEDVRGALEFIDQYAALNIGIADASLLVLAERYRCVDILTLDARHFRAMLGPGGRPFHLLPFEA